MSEIDKHYLTFDRPYIYTCSCGFMTYLHPDGSETIAQKPKGKIEYLLCGHAACAKTNTFVWATIYMTHKEGKDVYTR